MKVDGEAVSREQQLLLVSIARSANKIASARLVYLDGSASSSDFPLSNSDTFIPGKEVEILAGTGNDPVSIFQGIIIRQGLKIRDTTAPQLHIECRHKAVKLAVGRKNAYFFDQTDSDIIAAILDNAGLTPKVESTSVTHKQQVQYHCTDWDFLLTRAEANGKLVFTEGDQVIVKAPVFSGTPACTLQFGSTIIEMDAEIDARRQFSGVKSSSWDSAQQATLEKDAADPNLSGPGNLETDDLADVIGLESYELQHSSVTEDEAQAWADAEWLRSKMGKVNGRIKCEGIAAVNPGDIVTLAGAGDRYNGDVYVTGIRHDFDPIQGWKTHLQFGAVEQRLRETEPVSSPKSAGLLPGVNGLQIGVVVSNEDPDNEHRVRVRMPLVSSDEDGTWARVAAPDAGSERGFFFRPEIGDEVVLGFLDDDPRGAVILGMLHSSANAAPLQGSDDNNEKVYQSRSKMKLYFDDEKKLMQLETPAGNRISLNEDEKALTIEDQHGNKIEMTSAGIKITSSKALELKAATEAKLESGTSMSIKGGSELKVEGTSSAELSSSATTKVKGAIVQLN